MVLAGLTTCDPGRLKSLVLADVLALVEILLSQLSTRDYEVLDSSKDNWIVAISFIDPVSPSRRDFTITR